MSRSTIKAIGYIKSEDVIEYVIKGDSLKAAMMEMKRITLDKDEYIYKGHYTFFDTFVLIYSFKDAVFRVPAGNNKKIIMSETREVFNRYLKKVLDGVYG